MSIINHQLSASQYKHFPGTFLHFLQNNRTWLIFFIWMSGEIHLFFLFALKSCAYDQLWDNLEGLVRTSISVLLISNSACLKKAEATEFDPLLKVKWLIEC